MENKLKVRFAPSPTGFLHIGSARTALFNWLFAKRYETEFILRIEDTDLSRSKKEFLEEILDSLKWLGLEWSDIFHQSKRLDIYKQYAKKLVEQDKAFHEQEAIIFKYNFEEISFNDLVRGRIEFKELPKDTEVLIKSDGTPTYNFACCVDDGLLEITHVIRGEDHISNTPKQIAIYQALGFKIPEFAHLPMILSPEGGKLSKRFGATSIREYREEGYLSEAIVNYLLLLGWSPKANREIISVDEAASIFDPKDINKTAAAFSLDRLAWFNSEYIKSIDQNRLLSYIENYLNTKDFLPKDYDKDYLKKVIELFKTRTTKLSDLLERAYFCFKDDFDYSEEANQVLERKLIKEIASLKDVFLRIENFDCPTIENEFRQTAKNFGLKAKDLVHPVRVALTGKKIGPGLFETIEVLGKEKVVQRLDRLLSYWGQE